MINEVINMNILNELNEACDYIENNICKDIEIDELAKITNQSNDSINRFFVSMLGNINLLKFRIQ